MIHAKNCSIIFDFMDMYVGKKAMHDDVDFTISLCEDNETKYYKITNTKEFSQWLHDIFFDWVNKD